jgi:hypothetical protein
VCGDEKDLLLRLRFLSFYILLPYSSLPLRFPLVALASHLFTYYSTLFNYATYPPSTSSSNDFVDIFFFSYWVYDFVLTVFNLF